MAEDNQHFDCLIIGAGICGIDAAYHVQKYSPWAKYAVLERRDDVGGTWDFVKYPGIRSDSDMFSYSFSWRVWKSTKIIASGEEIKNYLTTAVEEEGIMKNIIFNTNIESAEWISSKNCWHLVTSSGKKFSCNVLFGCTGYYSYENPYEPTFPGQENFPGEVVHAQKWNPERHDKMILDKKVAIIGSGATAVTAFPAVAKVAKHVTLVQRTPSYIVSTPLEDKLGKFINHRVPDRILHFINRLKAWLFMLIISMINQIATRYPEKAKKIIKGAMYKEVESVMSNAEFEEHFSPPYNVVDQRVCMVPDGDFFQAIRDGKSSIATGQIDHFTENGIQMKNGKHVDADLVILATGMNIQSNFPFSTIKVSIDGEPYVASDHILHKCVMVNDVPNFAFIIGYFSLAGQSWTCRADIAAFFFSKMLNYMRENNITKLVPKEYSHDDDGSGYKPFDGGLSSGYWTRSAHVLPKQEKDPWKAGGINYIGDCISLYYKKFSTDNLELTVASSNTENNKKNS